MNEDKGIAAAHEPNTRKVLSFKAVIVMTKQSGAEPTLRDVETALFKAGMKYVMPGAPDAPIVISFSSES